MQRFVDAKGLACPMPLLKLKQALHHINVGDVLVIETSDPASRLDLRAFCRQAGHQVEMDESPSESEDSGHFRFVIIKG